MPGSVLKTMLGDKTSPILYGYDQNALAVMCKSAPVLSVGGAAAVAAAAAADAAVAGGVGGGNCSRWRAGAVATLQPMRAPAPD